MMSSLSPFHPFTLSPFHPFALYSLFKNYKYEKNFSMYGCYHVNHFHGL